MALATQIQYFVTRGPSEFQYKTLDSVATCLGAGYFSTPNTLVPSLHAGDRITILVCTNRGQPNEVVTDNATVIITSILAGVITVVQTGGGSGSGGLGSNSGAVNAVSLDPARAGVGHTDYSFGVGTAATSPDEAFYIGYNRAGVDVTEPAMEWTGEIDFPTRCRGVIPGSIAHPDTTTPRTLELYWQYTPTGRLGGDAFRPIFYSLEDGDDSHGHGGEINYGALSTGWNRASTPGGGGLSIYIDLQHDTTTVVHTFDIDGANMQQLRSTQDIQVLTNATTGTGTALSPMTITVASTAGYNIGARIQIYKPVILPTGTDPLWAADWVTGHAPYYEDGNPVVGVVWAKTSTTLSLFGVDNSSIGIVNGYGWGLAIPLISKYFPSFLGLNVGTGNHSSFTTEVAGTFGITGSMNIASTRGMIGLGTGIATGNFYNGVINTLIGDVANNPSDPHMVLTSATSQSQMAFGWLGSAGGFENLYFGLGYAQSTETNFTLANSTVAWYLDPNTASSRCMSIGGGDPRNVSRLRIMAGDGNYSNIFLSSSATKKATPLAGDMHFDAAAGGTLYFCRTAGTWSVVTMVP